MSSSSKTDAIHFLQSTIARYRRQLDGLQRRGSDAPGNVMELSRASLEKEQLTGLLEDAARLLSKLKAG